MTDIFFRLRYMCWSLNARGYKIAFSWNEWLFSARTFSKVICIKYDTVISQSCYIYNIYGLR